MADFFAELLHNRVLLAAVAGWMTAQVLKTLLVLIMEHELRWERLMGSGGMPSSHSATVCALATAAGIECGGGSYEFALAGILAVIVMYDAMGVRRETGIQARVLNEMMEILTTMGRKMSVEEKLKEFVGHTPIQVLMGALLGILIGVLMYL